MAGVLHGAPGRSTSRVDSITFSAVSPVPPLEIDCDIDTVTAVAPSDGPADVTAGVTGTPQQGWVGQVLCFRGYVLAMADMAQPNNPNARRSEPGWYARGRRRAIRHINRSGINGLRTLARSLRPRV